MHLIMSVVHIIMITVFNNLEIKNIHCSKNLASL